MHDASSPHPLTPSSNRRERIGGTLLSELLSERFSEHFSERVSERFSERVAARVPPPTDANGRRPPRARRAGPEEDVAARGGGARRRALVTRRLVSRVRDPSWLEGCTTRRSGVAAAPLGHTPLDLRPTWTTEPTSR